MGNIRPVMNANDLYTNSNSGSDNDIEQIEGKEEKQKDEDSKLSLIRNSYLLAKPRSEAEIPLDGTRAIAFILAVASITTNLQFKVIVANVWKLTNMMSYPDTKAILSYVCYNDILIDYLFFSYAYHQTFMIKKGEKPTRLILNKFLSVWPTFLIIVVILYACAHLIPIRAPAGPLMQRLF